MPEPWERQPGETDRAFEAFAVYRDLGASRSLAKTGQALSKNLTTLGDWSTANGWVARAAEWDAYLDRQAQAIVLQEIREELHHNAKLARKARAMELRGLGIVEGGWDRFDAKMENLDPDDPERVNAIAPVEARDVAVIAAMRKDASQSITGRHIDEPQRIHVDVRFADLLTDPSVQDEADDYIARMAAVRARQLERGDA